MTGTDSLNRIDFLAVAGAARNLREVKRRPPTPEAEFKKEKQLLKKADIILLPQQNGFAIAMAIC